MAENLRAQFPGLVVVAGAYYLPLRGLTLEEDEEIAQRINEAKLDIVWVGLGLLK